MRTAALDHIPGSSPAPIGMGSNVPTKLHPSVSAEDIRKQKARENGSKPGEMLAFGSVANAFAPPESKPRVVTHLIVGPDDEPVSKPPAASKTTSGMKIKRTARVMSSRIAVDSDIPPPSDAFGSQSYPFALLDVGQSFFVAKPKKGFTSVTNANKAHAPKVFTSRFMQGDDPKNPGKVGYRVWRIK